jgi:predicted CXXCH cytochrome family protein
MVVFQRTLPIAAIGLLVALSVTVASQSQPTAARNLGVAGPSGDYVGSESCRACHAPIYERWSKTRMANVVADPRQRPDAIIPDLNRPDPLLTFTRDSVALTYGSKWRQRYFTRVGSDFYPLPAQWDIPTKVWRPYFVQQNADWWAVHYPPDNTKRPTGPLCDGCHAVNYDIRSKTVTEWNVGCEQCHGPGREHAARRGRGSLVNPARLGLRGNDICIQCHSQGQPLRNPIDGQHYDWAVGYRVGLDLRDFWQLQPHKVGETSFTHYGDGTAHKNRMQGNDFAQSLMYRRGVRCFTCHDVHGTENEALLVRPTRTLCLTCHGPNAPNGPRAVSLEQHTQHSADGPGSECIACHMPRNAPAAATIINVRSHTFNFVTPRLTEQLGIPNPCLTCHTDRTTDWARDALKKWPTVSPWRLE